MTQALGQSLHPYLSEHAATAFADDPTPHWVEIDGSLAFFDISGFTPLTERLATTGRAGAEHINDVLNTVFRGLIDVVFEHGGDVLEFGGDAMVVLYTGDAHEQRAAVAAARMHRFMARKGNITTPAGKVRLGMSCGMAAGRQAYYLLGSTRRAFVVAGPVSTTMARLEARAESGQVLVDSALATALPDDWNGRAGEDGSVVLDLTKVGTHTSRRGRVVRAATPGVDTTMLLPIQFRDSSMSGVGRASSSRWRWRSCAFQGRTICSPPRARRGVSPARRDLRSRRSHLGRARRVLAGDASGGQLRPLDARVRGTDGDRARR